MMESIIVTCDDDSVSNVAVDEEGSTTPGVVKLEMQYAPCVLYPDATS